MANLKFCSCRHCKRGRKSKWNQYLIKHTRSAHRSDVKRKLKAGKWDDIPTAVSIPYTD